MKKQLFVLCGAPGSGKSTWVREHILAMPAPAAYVSRDEIRFSLVSEEEEYFSKEKEVFRNFISSIKNNLQQYNIVIADATHLNEASRTKLLRALGQSLQGVEVDAIVLEVSLNVALEQNEKRAGTRSYVPEAAVRRMFKQFTMPSFEEGFSKIYIYSHIRDTIDTVKCTILEKE